MHKKPMGDIGPLVASAGDHQYDLHWDRIGFPQDKVGQEQYVAYLFLEALQRQGEGAIGIEKLPECDHDALLQTGDGNVELQLMEIVLRRRRGSPYRSASRQYN